MQTLEAQLFVITFTLALLTIIIFLYKVMIRSLGGPDKKEKRTCFCVEKGGKTWYSVPTGAGAEAGTGLPC